MDPGTAIVMACSAAVRTVVTEPVGSGCGERWTVEVWEDFVSCWAKAESRGQVLEKLRAHPRFPGISQDMSDRQASRARSYGVLLPKFKAHDRGTPAVFTAELVARLNGLIAQWERESFDG